MPFPPGGGELGSVAGRHVTPNAPLGANRGPLVDGGLAHLARLEAIAWTDGRWPAGLNRADTRPSPARHRLADFARSGPGTRSTCTWKCSALRPDGFHELAMVICRAWHLADECPERAATDGVGPPGLRPAPLLPRMAAILILRVRPEACARAGCWQRPSWGRSALVAHFRWAPGLAGGSSDCRRHPAGPEPVMGSGADLATTCRPWRRNSASLRCLAGGTQLASGGASDLRALQLCGPGPTPPDANSAPVLTGVCCLIKGPHGEASPTPWGYWAVRELRSATSYLERDLALSKKPPEACARVPCWPPCAVGATIFRPCATICSVVEAGAGQRAPGLAPAAPGRWRALGEVLAMSEAAGPQFSFALCLRVSGGRTARAQSGRSSFQADGVRKAAYWWPTCRQHGRCPPLDRATPKSLDA